MFFCCSRAFCAYARFCAKATKYERKKLKLSAKTMRTERKIIITGKEKRTQLKILPIAKLQNKRQLVAVARAESLMFVEEFSSNVLDKTYGIGNHMRRMFWIKCVSSRATDIITMPPAINIGKYER